MDGDGSGVETRALVDVAAEFSRAYLRHLDGSSQGGFSYPRLRVLETLHCQGPMTMRPLADAVGLSARNLTAVADSLEADALIRRVPHPTDRRATILEITEAGLAVADESLAPRLAEIDAVFAGLSADERHRLSSVLGRLVERLNRGCPILDNPA